MSQTAINNSILTPLTGAIRLETSLNQMQVYDGSSWVVINGQTIPFKKQQSIESLCEKHPGLAELKKELDEAQQKFDAYLALIRE